MSAAPTPAASALSPFRHRWFRAFWIANLVSNFGQWSQTVGAAWLMLTIAPEPDMVALVQSAASLPTLVFCLVGGVLADILDRRFVYLGGQLIMLGASVLLALVDGAGGMTPWVLLFFTFAIGTGSALRQPAFQASVGDLVPRAELASAVALNSVGFNIARSAGPAVGGLIVAASGPEAAFLFSAVANIGLVVVLLLWRAPSAGQKKSDETLVDAAKAGVAYALGAPTMRTILVRCLVFSTLASAAWALLPLIAKHDLGGGPFTYGLLLGGLGFGAIAGAGLIVRLRTRFSTEAQVTGATIVFGLVTAALSFLHALFALLPVLIIGGAAWLTVLSTFNVSVQVTAPVWVKARAFSIYLTVLFGGLAFGSWFWGHVAAAVDVYSALAAAGLLLVASSLLARRLALPDVDRAAAKS